MAILSAKFIILSALVNSTFFINRPPGVTKAYIYLYQDHDDQQQHMGDWIELRKNFRFGGVYVFEANISDYIAKRKCETEIISYRLRLVYYNDANNYGDTPKFNKILIPKRCNTSIHYLSSPEMEYANMTTQQPQPSINETNNFRQIIVGNTSTPLYFNTTNDEIFNCTLTNVLLFSLSVNSGIFGIVYIIVKGSFYLYYKLKDYLAFL